MSRPRFDRLAYREPTPSRPLMDALGILNRYVILPGVLRVAEIDFPQADLTRLRATLRQTGATFLAPHHPEFTTDWLIDKEIARRSSALMAHWASYEVVNIHPVAQWVWLRNNLIANAPGGAGKEYSVRWALAGHGVLLHPEGVPSWHGDRVGPLVPGVIDMALEAARQGGGRATVAPLVWKLRFRGDVSRELHQAITHIERMLGVPSAAKLPLEQRFAALQALLLERSMARYGKARTISVGTFFADQEQHVQSLFHDLESRHGTSEGDRRRRAHALRRALLAAAGADPERARQDRRALAEIERLGHFTEEYYGGPTLTQEQIAESLTQIRLALAGRGLREGLFGVLPVAVARRVASIRVPDPLTVTSDDTSAEKRQELLHELRDRLQGALDRLGAELEPAVGRYRRPNPFRP
ncbi:MAG TPA: hypothetical protein VKF80_11580 [Candidatus Eisenbacteria bacterium]|nr:hypothetical protein [Candidatus Eisenbacteria bacterium]